MKIAEALIKRAAIKSDLEELKNRMIQNVKIQDGDMAQEDVYAIMDEYIWTSDYLTELIYKINRTNQQTTDDEGISLADMITQRDTYKNIVKVYKSIYDEAMIRPSRYSRNEIKFISTVDVEKIQNSINEYSAKYRALDTKIQGINWTKDLIE